MILLPTTPSNLVKNILKFGYFFFFTALILEEIAIDNEDKSVREPLLREARELHVQSLTLAINAFGESNVQTAKHYGNLGRLYQSMHEFKVRISNQT